MKQSLVIRREDNVGIALKNLVSGTLISFGTLRFPLKEPVRQGHKFALNDIKAGEQVIKYGMPIGYVSEDVMRGSWVHTHNMCTALSGTESYHYTPDFQSYTVSQPDREIEVYHRADGEIGIRNELWVIPTVGCVNAIAQRIVQRFIEEVAPDDIDGVYALTHPYGCSQMGEDHQATRTILQNMVCHPNSGGVLVIGLGCENNQVSSFQSGLGMFDRQRTRFLVAQEMEDEVASGVQQLTEIYQAMREDRRENASIGQLKVGLECGGSDGLSGITANPLLGLFSDYLIHHGGSSVLTEVPEMFGAETLLFNRCCNPAVFHKAVAMVNGFKDYFEQHGQVVYENPSPGNKDGGISTLEDKSMGCTQKAGLSPVRDVLKYGERLRVQGLNLLEAPGNDAVATSALAASGCHLVLFTTGRGTPYGGFVPTLKIASNSELATRKPGWIDFNAGRFLEKGNEEELLAGLIDRVIGVANGLNVCHEKNGYRDLSIFKQGVTL